MELRKVRDLLKEDLKDPHFKELYELDQQKLAVVKMIVAYRVKHDLTQGQFAHKIGMTQQYISKIENGDFSSVAALEKVLLAIGYMVKMTVVPLRPRHAQHPLALQVA
jgi:DNA-binding XRE family transcriptional regulator